MDILQPSDLSSFIIFFIPGFISLQIYHLIIPSEKLDFSSSCLEIISFSVLNFVILHPIYQITDYLHFLVAFFIAPIIWPFLYIKIISYKPISNFIINPILKPWDFIFKKKEPLWIIVYLTDGRLIGGLFQKKSNASSYPAEEQIYIEQVWELDDNNEFIKPIECSNGIIIFKDSILAMEFRR